MSCTSARSHRGLDKRPGRRRVDGMGAIFSGRHKSQVLVVGLDNSGKSSVINFLKPAKDKVGGAPFVSACRVSDQGVP